ncbi:ATP/GTP-binding protein [Streptomyces alkaliterrae]|uniref:ATP/GTP-binding protein n=1 Tax=Streptomyces alkaliterrae TaxID=2213162 RepID=A0A5P0YSK3_9ACTN|nr:ATP/GTP-binding protein [Streptomyces alkaliterrae]MBB1252999.1 ATP/GTP-binding protein [Streptomyces alkaliterrae]MBB1257534.1 ATP/GTP-binding protein [Streptomyces alkaliterrae]MQS02577.1 ATP/GTP-binding protein [Streptomyces alkaliterrae]
MSPRRNRPRSHAKSGPEAEVGERYGLQQSESWLGERWSVRHISGAAAVKHYRCPGCDQEIPPGVPHVVAWPEHGDGDDRRHWHKACWKARDRRAARTQRSRQAPRY